MRQLLQDLSSGEIKLQEVPCPRATRGHVLVRTSVSLVSAGTERMLLEFGKATLLGKARHQPERVKQAWEKARTDGLVPTLQAVRAKLDQPISIGYCNAGEVLDVGTEVADLVAGDRVVSNGSHAEVVLVPANLCAKIPPGVTDHDAAFVVLGAVALQGIRLAAPTLGETFAVIGLGLVGQLACQLLRAHGCRVLGIDPEPSRVELARKFGVEALVLSAGDDPVAAAKAYSGERGVDGAIIAASTSSDGPIHQAAQMCRKRGRIVLVGVTGLKLSRADFYEKELSFQVSCSYGPGRYDSGYESGRYDYPLGFVRWTARRNFEAVLALMEERKLDVGPLVSHRFPLDHVDQAYDLITGRESSLGVLIEYPDRLANPDTAACRRTLEIMPPKAARIPGPDKVTVAIAGAGSFAMQVLIPAIGATGARTRTVVSLKGTSGALAARKFGFERATTDLTAAFDDPEIDAVVIATRHDSHAQLVCEALQAGKHVFVEKPLALDEAQLVEVEKAYQSARARGLLLMVDFNRRFAPQIGKIRSLLESVREPKNFIVTVNAGAIASDHWTQDAQQGGGRIIGEGCHFIDLTRFLAGHPAADVQVAALRRSENGVLAEEDKVTFTLSFADGSVGTIHYLANGHRSFPKERLEVFAAGRILRLDNFRRLQGYGWKGFKRMNLWRQNKGHSQALEAFFDAIRRTLPPPIPFEELAEVTRLSFEVAAKARGSRVPPNGNRAG